jgi:nucleotide-binding universal stress UspA family protein
MYKSIYVPVDNSDHSNRAVACALGLGKAYSAKLVGCHVYAAKLHDYRFRQMEYTLPEDPSTRWNWSAGARSRQLDRWPRLISDSYLDACRNLRRSGLSSNRGVDGKHRRDPQGSRRLAATWS